MARIQQQKTGRKAKREKVGREETRSAFDEYFERKGMVRRKFNEDHKFSGRHKTRDGKTGEKMRNRQDAKDAKEEGGTTEDTDEDGLAGEEGNREWPPMGANEDGGCGEEEGTTEDTEHTDGLVSD